MCPFAYPASRYEPSPLVDLHSLKLADEWAGLPNTNRIFAGMTPLAYMLRGGAPAMLTVRRLLDARRGAL